jgi:hypothetical protein
MDEQQMIQRMDSYVLVFDEPRIALTTRIRLHLDDSFWQHFVRERKLFFRDAEIMLNRLSSSLSWFDVTQVVREYRHDNLIIRRIGGGFSFDVVHEGIPLMAAICKLKNERLCFVPIYSSIKCDTILWEHLIDRWNDAYRKAVRDIYGFEAEGWPYHTFLLVHELCDDKRYDDARDVFQCAIARAKAEGRDELVAKFESIKQQLLVQ